MHQHLTQEVIIQVFDGQNIFEEDDFVYALIWMGGLLSDDAVVEKMTELKDIFDRFKLRL